MWARNGRWIFPEMPDFHVAFRNLLHAVNLRHGTDGFISPPKEGVLRTFSPWKIRRLRPGLNPRTWVPKALNVFYKFRLKNWEGKQYLFLLYALLIILHLLDRTGPRENFWDLIHRNTWTTSCLRLRSDLKKKFAKLFNNTKKKSLLHEK